MRQNSDITIPAACHAGGREFPAEAGSKDELFVVPAIAFKSPSLMRWAFLLTGRCCDHRDPPMSYFVYILQSQMDGSYYTGSTQDLDSRIERHNQPQERSVSSVISVMHR